MSFSEGILRTDVDQLDENSGEAIHARRFVLYVHISLDKSKIAKARFLSFA